MGLLKGLLGLAGRRSPDMPSEEELIRLRKAMQYKADDYEPEYTGSADEVQSLLDSVLNPKPTRAREMQLRKRLEEMEQERLRNMWLTGGVGYGAYQLGRKDERERR